MKGTKYVCILKRNEEMELKGEYRGAWLPQLVDHVIIDLRVIGSTPALGIKIT